MKHTRISPDLGVLVKWWMSIWQAGCSSDWRCLLPEIDYQNPDRSLQPNHLPVLSYLPKLIEQAPDENQAFIHSLMQCSNRLHFNQTYTEDDIGADFLKQYGWIKFIGPDGYWDSNDLSGGLVLFGDDVSYPEHWMAAEGLYYIISGTSDWYREDIGWTTRTAGEWVTHGSNVKHGLKTTGEPLLLMYILRGENLSQKSTLNTGESASDLKADNDVWI